MRAAAENFFDVGAKADVEHAVGLVEDDDFQIAQLQRAAGEMIENAAGRADDDFGAAAQFIDLSANGLTAVEGDGMQFAAVRELDNFFTDLDGKLAGRHQDKRLGAGMFFAYIDLFQNRNRESGGFAGAGARLTEHVDSGKGAGNEASLNRRGLGIPSGRQSRKHRGRKI